MIGNATDNFRPISLTHNFILGFCLDSPTSVCTGLVSSWPILNVVVVTAYCFLEEHNF